MGNSKADLKGKHKVTVMEVRFEVKIKGGVNKFNIVKANAKEGDVTVKDGLKCLDSLHILYKLNDASNVTQFLSIS